MPVSATCITVPPARKHSPTGLRGRSGHERAPFPVAPPPVLARPAHHWGVATRSVTMALSNAAGATDGGRAVGVNPTTSPRRTEALALNARKASGVGPRGRVKNGSKLSRSTSLIGASDGGAPDATIWG